MDDETNGKPRGENPTIFGNIHGKLTWLAGKWSSWRCIPYWKWGYSIAMLVYWRVTQQHGCFSTCFASFHRLELFHLFFQQVFYLKFPCFTCRKHHFRTSTCQVKMLKKETKKRSNWGNKSNQAHLWEFFGRFFCSRNSQVVPVDITSRIRMMMPRFLGFGVWKNQILRLNWLN